MINTFIKIYVFAFIIFYSLGISAQKVTKIVGQVIDAQTHKTMPFVDIGFVGTTIGISTDFDGNFVLETRFPSDSLFVSYIGYKTQYFLISKGVKNKIKVKLSGDGLLLDVVEIKTKKTKYNKKNNPALELAQKVIGYRYNNSLKGKKFYSYKQHEKIQVDFNNITEGIKHFPLVANIDFILDYLDTSDVNGKTYLPVFLRETLSNVYYKKDGNILKERRFASRSTQIEDGPDQQTINDVLDALYQDIDIYEEKIDLLDKQFLSPFSKSGDDFYRYYIIDTTTIDQIEMINLAFIPAIKGNFGFTGNIYISNDGNFTVLIVEMTILRDINLNFVSDIKIVQEFKPLGNAFIKTKDQLVVDYSLTDNGLGVFGSRTLYFTDFNFKRQKDKYYRGVEKIIYDNDASYKTDKFWSLNRIRPLEKEELGIKNMVDSLNTNKFFKAYKYIGKLIATGYAPIGAFNLGSLSSFVTFNEVEGLNLRLGGESNYNLSKKVKLSAYAAYPLKTKRWKYAAGLTYSFKNGHDENPRHYLKLIAERESSFPGKELEFFKPESIFVSFQRGDATRMFFTNTYEVNYTHEMNGFSYYIYGQNRKREPYGSLTFLSKTIDGEDVTTPNITTTEVGIGLRYAPNEKFLQGKKERRQIYNEFPIINIDFVQGIDNVFNGGYNYSKLKFNLFKQLEWNIIGSTNFIFEAGKTWGKLPYLLQLIPRGNQTYTYHLNSYNMMNFMEFTTDQFVSLNMEHYFQGYLFNRIPYVKNLKLRTVISFKSIYGSLADDNNPFLDPTRIQFPLDEFGNQATFLFGDEPYMETSIGFTNIFKVLRFDLVKRINYLDQPNVPSLLGVKGLGVRMKIHLEF